MSDPDEGPAIESHFALLKQQKENLAETKRYKGQRPLATMKKSRELLQAEFGTLAIQIGMQGLMKRYLMFTTFIGEAYPPCDKPLSSLAPITLKELVLETHHRGRVLVVRLFCLPSRMVAIQNGIEDVNGEVDRIAVQNLHQRFDPQRVLPMGAIVAVKEPYYKVSADKGVLVRVDHPSDLIMLRLDDPIVPEKWRLGAEITHMTPQQLKEAGNSAYKKQDWDLASDVYTQALETGPENEDLRRDLHRNRAGARLNLNQFDWALDDAMASIIPDASTEAAKLKNRRAFYRAGMAEYKVGNFNDAKSHFNRALELDADDADALSQLQRTNDRLSEQLKGEYDFMAMDKSASNEHFHLDHASFTQHTKIGPAAGKRGRGLFATKDFEIGDVIMVEKAFAVAREEDCGRNHKILINVNTNHVKVGTSADLLPSLVDILSHNPRQARRYLKLTDGGGYSRKGVKVVDGKFPIDVFQVQAIAELNGFSCAVVKSSADDGRTKSNSTSTGIWIRASYCNHSCLANAQRAFIGDMMVVRAIRNIKAGEEITLHYCTPEDEYDKRKKKFEYYGFECDCALCKVESGEPAAVVRRRYKLAGLASDFLKAKRFTSIDQEATTASVKQAFKLLEGVLDTYKEDAYTKQKLPRLMTAQLSLWLCQAHASSDLQTMLRIAMQALRDAGYFITVDPQGLNPPVIDATNCVPSMFLAHAARFISQFYELTADDLNGNGLFFIDLASKIYMMECGSLARFEERFRV